MFIFTKKKKNKVFIYYLNQRNIINYLQNYSVDCLTNTNVT